MQSNSFPSRARIAPGTRLNGIYEIDHAIGAGGMGEIYKGHNIQTGDVVAIKVMLPELGENQAAMALFRKEASALHSLHHEAIVRYYVFTVEPTLQRPYLAMEFVEGQSLSDRLKHGPLTFEAIYALKNRLAAGLQAAHERGVIHRDVSPDNIIIPGGDVSRAKIIDFGIARSTQLGEGTIIGGGFAGKYNYVSPEQLGLFGGDVTGRSDIYSLGLLLAEALTGQPIDMGGSQLDVIEKRRKVPHLGAIDLRVRPLIEKMLQPDPANRPESMAVVAAWQVGAERPLSARQGYESRPSAYGVSPQTGPGGRGRKVVLAASIAVLLLGGAGAGLYYYLEPGTSATAPRPPGLRPTTKLDSPPVDVAKPAPDAPAPLSPEPASPTLTPSAPGRPPIGAESPAAAPVVPGQPSRPDGPPELTPALPSAPNTQIAFPKLPPATPPPLQPGPELRPTPTPPAAVGPADPITRFVNEYQGGDCFFVTPIAVSAQAAKIDGYGVSIGPFQALDEAFKRAHRFEADIGVRQVTKAQCPAVTFLSQLRKAAGAAPHLEIGAASLKSGQALTGRIDGHGNSHVELLLVSDEGSVLNVSSLLKPAGSGKTFNLRMQRTGASGPQPQLLIAVTSSKPLDTLRPRGAVEADLFFPLVLGEAARSGQTIAATARYFKLDL
jgi:serine/threonine-protein kinase